MAGKGGSKTRAGARGNEKSYRSSLLEIGRVGYFFRRIHQIEKGSQANRRKGEELSTTVSGCTPCGSLHRRWGRSTLLSLFPSMLLLGSAGRRVRLKERRHGTTPP